MNRTTDLSNTEDRVAVALELRNLFKQGDLIDVATKPILDSTSRKKMFDSAQQQLLEWRNQFEKELGGGFPDQAPKDLCCIVMIISVNEKWSVQESRDPASAFPDIQNMLNQPMNGDEILDFVMFPRPNQVLSLEEGRQAFKNVCSRMMQTPVHV
jgi:hypothetical protein